MSERPPPPPIDPRISELVGKICLTESELAAAMGVDVDYLRMQREGGKPVRPYFLAAGRTFYAVRGLFD
jgi:hypothetical protein